MSLQIQGHGDPRWMTYRQALIASVFNATQIDVPATAGVKTITSDSERHVRAEAILNRSGARISHVSGDRAFYQPSTDRITLPERRHFCAIDAYRGEIIVVFRGKKGNYNQRLRSII